MKEKTDVKKIKEVPWSGVGALYTEEEIALVGRVMRETRDTLTQGKYQKEFERAFCAYNGNDHAFAVSSCTAALELAALLSRVGPGDEVIIPSHTFCATAIPFARTGAKLVWCDIDPETLVVTAETIRKVVTDKTKVIVVVHLYGLAAEMNSILSLAAERDLQVVEDCAQALGAECGGRKVGTFGDYGCFSFHTHKNISTLGEGGILTVKDPNRAKLVPGLRHNGCCPYPEPREKYWVPAMSNVEEDIPEVWPYNFCIGEVQCALGAAILQRVDALIALRVSRMARFKEALKDYPELVFPKIPDGQTTSGHLLVARYDQSVTGKTSSDFIDRIYREYGIKAIVQYYPLNRYPLFQKHGLGQADCPAADSFFDNMISFPFHSWLSDETFEYLISSSIAVLDRLRAEAGEG